MSEPISALDSAPPMGGSPPPDGLEGKIARFFDFAGNGTNLRTEILAGLTTFMTMAYILVVNPIILGDAIFLNKAGDLFPELMVATALSSAVGTLTMALVSNYPFCLAPGMGMNAFFSYSVVLGLGIDWRLALGCVFVEGLIFIALTLTDIRRHIIKAIPDGLKNATGAGIGLFIAYIGLAGDPAKGGAGLIVANAATKTAFGSLLQPTSLMAIVGLLITAAFLVRRIKGALLWGILGTALLGWGLGITPAPSGLLQIPPLPKDLFGQGVLGLANLNGDNVVNFIAAMFVFLFVDIFDTVGTLAGVGQRAGYIDDQGELPRANQALFADAIATTAGAILGTSSVTTFVESASGIAEGGRTGFTAVVTGGLFVFSILFIPVFQAIPAYATAPALVLVGVMMMANVLSIRWNDFTEAIPAFFVIFMIPLTYSIAEGLSIGFITYPLVKLFQGKGREVPLPTWIIAGVFVARFVFMTLRFGKAA